MTLALFEPPVATARLSPCGTYRYHLTRTWAAAEPVAAFVMLNPSTADAREDDPTIRKCVGFAKRWGCGSIEVVNVFALRSTDPAGIGRAILAGVDPVGPQNDAAIDGAMLRADLLVLAWGANDVGDRGRAVFERARDMGRAALCIGTTKDGSPRHPLMVAYATPLTAWRAA